MKRVIITLVTMVVYIALIVQMAMYDIVKNYFPDTLTEEGYLPDNLYAIHEVTTYAMHLFLVLMLFYIVYSAFSSVVPNSKKYLWVWLIFFGNFLVIPFFWYYYVWNEKQYFK